MVQPRITIRLSCPTVNEMVVGSIKSRGNGSFLLPRYAKQCDVELRYTTGYVSNFDKKWKKKYLRNKKF